ncbi:hypothetical protein [Burkholderia metallica]|uniref:hypothetical protein n=1 Tax=Burkholderia metallica TaxID=488729 RepID=UPI001CF57C81|nr:hypothetical protein [Burkholderia metallica]MCA8000676.1 hypothetical protein [Burkholderia metallica]
MKHNEPALDGRFPLFEGKRLNPMPREAGCWPRRAPPVATDCSPPNRHAAMTVSDLLRGTYLDWNRVIDATTAGKDGDPETSPALVSFITRLRDKAESVAHPTDGDGDSIACADVFPQYLAFEFDVPGKLSFSVSGIGHAMGARLGPQLDASFAALAPVLKPGGSRYLVPGVKLK